MGFIYLRYNFSYKDELQPSNRNNSYAQPQVNAIIVMYFIDSFWSDEVRVSLQELQAYEGKYEYINNGTLQIAASPIDTLLYAIINQSRYPLVPFDKDVFKNSSGDQVRFLRNSANHIVGYTGIATIK